MKNKMMLASLAFCLGVNLNASPFLISDFDKEYKKFHDEIAVFFNNNGLYKNSYPKMNVFEDQVKYSFKFELPGIEKKDIKVTINNHNILNVSGTTKSFSKEEKKNIIVNENYHGSFSRSISLPDNIDNKDIKVIHKNGILEVIIKKDIKKIENSTRTLKID